MRLPSRLTLLTAAGLLAIGCSDRQPTSAGDTRDELATLAAATESTLAGARGIPILGALRFPEAIRLSAEQESQIRQLLEAFQAANASDIAALDALMLEMTAARRAGATREQLHAILLRAQPFRERLHAAQRELHANLWAVLTPAQRDYVLAQRDSCRLTPEQARQLHALHEAFQQVNAADLAIERLLMQQIAEAVRSGASREQIQAIYESGRAARERLAAARLILAQQARQLLGANGCELPPPPR